MALQCETGKVGGVVLIPSDLFPGGSGGEPPREEKEEGASVARGHLG